MRSSTFAIFKSVMLIAGAMVAVTAVAPGASAQGIKVGIFDAQKVTNESEAGKKIQDELNTFSKAKETEMQQREVKVKELQDKLRQQALSLSPDRRAEMEKQIQREMLDLQSFQESASRELQLEYAAAQRSFEEKLFGAIDAFAKDEGFDLIMDRSQVAWSSNAIDVTGAIVDLVNRLYPPADG